MHVDDSNKIVRRGKISEKINIHTRGPTGARLTYSRVSSICVDDGKRSIRKCGVFGLIFLRSRGRI